MRVIKTQARRKLAATSGAHTNPRSKKSNRKSAVGDKFRQTQQA